tara:strand:+ start:228 stop:764 length:537 start_codon:yes stop_codon:yes gene_type:complete
MAQIISITSEALQATIRRLLPSQQGFGEDLQAQNVVVPIIDLTPTAEGSALPADLQRAVNYTDATAFDINNTSTTVANSPGFYRLIGTSTIANSGAADTAAEWELSIGGVGKKVWGQKVITFGGSTSFASVSYDFVCFIPANAGLTGICTGNAQLNGSIRQIADVYGVLKNPTLFQSQ